MENLIEVLGQEGDEYEGLLALSQKKMRIIASANLEDLQRITDDEQEVVSRLNRLEKRRIEVTADIANVLNRDVETMKLTNLIEMMAPRPAEQAKLEEIHDRLRNVVREVQRTNEQNRELLGKELKDYQAAPETANYTRNAYNSGAQMGVDSTGFDAKQ